MAKRLVNGMLAGRLLCLRPHNAHEDSIPVSSTASSTDGKVPGQRPCWVRACAVCDHKTTARSSIPASSTDGKVPGQRLIVRTLARLSATTKRPPYSAARGRLLDHSRRLGGDDPGAHVDVLSCWFLAGLAVVLACEREPAVRHGRGR
jgi:hypothetical protein